MRWGESRIVAMKSIIAPGDLRERMAQPHVIALAGTCKRYGGRPGNRMWVMKVRQGWRLIAGRDRYAAQVINDAKEAPVEVIEDATPEELADLEEIENLYRRPVENRDELIRARVAKLAARFKVEPELADTASDKPGRPVTPEGRAREQVAAETGRSKEAVRKAEARATAKLERHDDIAADDVDEGAALGVGRSRPAPPPIDTHGHEMPPRMADVAGLVKQYGAIEKAARELRAKVAELDLFGSSVKGENAALLHDVERFLVRLRAATPSDLCPYCEGTAGVKCAVCFESGWVSRAKYESAPAEKRGPVTPKKRAARVVIVNEDGSETEVVS